MEKPYDTTWKHGILLDLYKTGLSGPLPMFICDFYYFIVILKFVSEIYTLILTHRRQVFHRVVFSLSRYLVLRLIVLYLVYDVNCSLYVGDFSYLLQFQSYADYNENFDELNRAADSIARILNISLIYDSKLSFIPHITSLKSRCTKSLDLINVLFNTTWGADRKVLLRLYRALIRSKLDYGCIVHGFGRPSYIK